MSKNPDTLVCRFCGLHSLTLYNLTIYFMVMQSVYQTERKIHERYDLKGSYIDRHADLSQTKKRETKKQQKARALARQQQAQQQAALAAAGGTTTGDTQMHPPVFSSDGARGFRTGGFKNVVYKDNDLNRTVRLAESDRAAFLKQVTRDAYFLRDSGIMDYSLLLGVHHTSHVVPLMSPNSSTGSFAGDQRGSAEPLLAAGEPVGSGSHKYPQHITLTPLASRTTSSSNGAAAGGMLPHKSSNVSSTHSSAGAFTKDEGGVQASIIEGPGIYYFGIIDCLQEYNTAKKMER